MQKSSGRPKDLAKKAKILQAATAIFLKMGYHATSMQHIAQEAGVSKLTVYNHFQDKANLFTCAIETSCETSIFANPVQLTADSLFEASLTLMCQRALNVAYLPEALKLDRLLFELAAEQSPLTEQFFNASHIRMRTIWAEFFQQAVQLKFIQAEDPFQQTELIVSLLLGMRHYQVLLGLADVPSPQEMQQQIQQTVEIFLLKYQIHSQ